MKCESTFNKKCAEVDCLKKQIEEYDKVTNRRQLELIRYRQEFYAVILCAGGHVVVDDLTLENCACERVQVIRDSEKRETHYTTIQPQSVDQ